jgi:hypothetical protein
LDKAFAPRLRTLDVTIRRLVAENLGYALLGGPVLAIASFLVGSSLLGTPLGVGCAVAVYGLGWTLAARRSERRTEPPTDSDDERTRRENELEAEKGSFGGGGG